MNLWTRLEQIADQRSVLRHPFYVRWSEGKLTRDELAHYAGQYRHAVVALANAAAAAARSREAGGDAPALAVHAREEASHVALWDEFVAQVGGEPAAEASADTRACVDAWEGGDDRPLLETLTTMYAVESAQPAIARVKLDGLRQYYGIDSSRYFELHEWLDVEHAAGARRLIERRLAGADQGALVAAADRALEANWLLLDGVEPA